MSSINIDGYVIPNNLLYSENHVWARAKGDILVLGITDFLQKILGTIINVHFPSDDLLIRRGNPLVWLESLKAVVAILSPINCELIEINERLRDKPYIMNIEPYDGGWIAVVKALSQNDLRVFKSAEAYARAILALSRYEQYQVS
ncbi:MAG: glycine cleavage system protein H [Candidatus Nezhaarchaeales archaeon]